MNIAFFGSSLVSAYRNGAAAYYRGIVSALHERGHRVTFYEPDAYERQAYRDMEDPPWAKVIVYPAYRDDARRALDHAKGADLIVKASGVGILDELLEAEVLELKRWSNLVVYWDVDAPATLDRIRNDPADPFASHIPRYDMVFTYGGGRAVVEGYTLLGARACIPIYNALDPEIHHPVPPDPRFSGDLAFLGNRLPDSERLVEEFFLQPAERLPQKRFLLGGAGWEDKPRSPNIAYFKRVCTPDHNAFNSSPRAVINISGVSMASDGYSPATRIFEAAGAGACLVTDAWEGLEMFLEPHKEILVAHNGIEVVEILAGLSAHRARAIGEAAYRRVLRDHTYDRRAARLEAALEGVCVLGAGAQ